MQADKEKEIQQKRGILIYSLAPTKTLDSTSQSNLTITLVSYIKSPCICQNFCRFLSVDLRSRSFSNNYATLDYRRWLPLDRPQEEKQQSASNPVAVLRQS